MKVCPDCARSYSNEAVVCAFDGAPLSEGSTSSWDTTESSEPGVGDVLGQYRIVARVGQGGMGVIFKAEHVRLGRIAALKVLRSALVRRGNIVQRFFAEARAVNDIGHPNIVDVIDFVEIVDIKPPLVYMVMEFLDGENLGERLKRDGPLSPVEARSVALQIVSALAATHNKQVLHRDLKPQNVFLVPTEDGPPRVKVLDFGVSKAFGDRKGDDLTHPGSAVGTPYYMAPEQILRQEPDPRTDIYALGVMLYEVLVGEVPFKAKNRADLLAQHVRVPPPSLRKRRPDLPPRLVRLVMTCLQKDPNHRYPDMLAVKAELETCLETRPDPPSAARHRPWIWLLPLVALVAVGAVGAYGILGFESDSTARTGPSLSPGVAGAPGTPGTPAPDGRSPGGRPADGGASAALSARDLAASDHASTEASTRDFAATDQAPGASGGAERGGRTKVSGRGGRGRPSSRRGSRRGVRRGRSGAPAKRSKGRKARPAATPAGTVDPFSI